MSSLDMRASEPLVLRTTGLAAIGYPALIALTLVIGVVLRAHELSSVPSQTATADELAWTWSGMTLVDHGVPTSWSLLSAYPASPDTAFNGASFHLVTPWLDHPPLFSLFMGAWMHAFGQHEVLSVSFTIMRASSLLLFACTLLLLERLTRRLIDRSGALLACGFFAISAPMVLSTKLVVSENLIAPATLLLIELLQEDPTTKSKWRDAIVVLLAAAFPLIKIAGVTVSIFAVVWLVWARRVRTAVLVILGTAIGLGAFVAFAAHLDFGLFVDVMSSHRRRFGSFAGAYELLLTPKVARQAVFYPAFALGIFAVLTRLATNEPSKVLAVHVCVYALVMNALMGANEVYGWYQIPLYPAICVGIAIALRHLWTSERWEALLGASLFLLPFAFESIADVLGLFMQAGALTLSRFAYVGGVALLISLAAGAYHGLIPSRQAFRAGVIAMFVCVMFGDVSAVLLHRNIP